VKQVPKEAVLVGNAGQVLQDGDLDSNAFRKGFGVFLSRDAGEYAENG
jgi:hypothetical protein